MALLHTATGWWIDEAGAPEPQPAFSGFADADVVVIGGGYLGMWTAWQLLEREPACDVVLLEAGQCGHGPSGRNGGFVNGYWGYVPELANRYGVSRAVALATEADDSIAAIGRFCEQQKIDAWYLAVPQVDVSTAKAQDGSWSDEIEGLRALGHGEEYSELTAAQVQQVCGSPAFRGGAVARSAATIQPARLAFGLRGALLRRGVRIHEATEALGVEQSGGDRVLVRTHAPEGGGRGT